MVRRDTGVADRGSETAAGLGISRHLAEAHGRSRAVRDTIGTRTAFFMVRDSKPKTCGVNVANGTSALAYEWPTLTHGNSRNPRWKSRQHGSRSREVSWRRCSLLLSAAGPTKRSSDTHTPAQLHIKSPRLAEVKHSLSDIMAMSLAALPSAAVGRIPAGSRFGAVVAKPTATAAPRHLTVVRAAEPEATEAQAPPPAPKCEFHAMSSYLLCFFVGPGTQLPSNGWKVMNNSVMFSFSSMFSCVPTF